MNRSRALIGARRVVFGIVRIEEYPEVKNDKRNAGPGSGV